MTSSGPAVLFDIDGTLIDSNWFHTVSWWRALQDGGEDIAMSQIHPLIGMGSDKLLGTLLGEERESLSDAHSEYYEPYKELLHPFPRAAELLGEVSKRGAKVVLATSSKEKDLQELLDAIGAEDGVIDEIVHGDMVEASKPAPDIFAVALERVGLDPGQTIVVGDTGWDVEAAAKVGVDVVAVLTGGWTRADLEEKGAVAVYDDVADLLDHLDDSPLARLLS
ncbi:MAG TPA: HAD family hydrolase [Acidimicrobiales bacterium]|jgi:HAD superfamily hydrolase (TIGR01509 family)|nr:HAD family hydrolase [Acidimicrobiales bacterium]